MSPAAAHLDPDLDTGPVDVGSIAPTDVAARTLAEELAWLRDRLVQGPDDAARRRPTRSTRLDHLAGALDMSSFERDTLLLAAAVELDGELARLVAEACDGSDPRPTFGLALQVLDDGHWDALAPDGPLRRWRLVDPGGTGILATRRLRVDEDVLHHLAGLPLALHGLDGLVEDGVVVPLAPSQQRRADHAAAALGVAEAPTCLRIDGVDRVAGLGVALRVATHLADRASASPDDPPAIVLSVPALPPPGPELMRVAALVDRAQRLTGRVPVLLQPPAGRSPGDLAPDRTESARRLLGTLTAPVVATVGTSASAAPGRVVQSIEVVRPRAPERRDLWRRALDPDDAGIEPQLGAVADELAHHHRLAAHEITTIVRRWEAGAAPRPEALRRVTRASTRVDLDDLARRLDTGATWDDLVLPDGHVEVLRDLARRVRHRAVVHTDWGFGDTTRGDVGTSALFVGDSGTGKTLAARVVAQELGLDLYRVDLSATVDKYIGETEKNVSRIFDAAEAGGVVLLFDEADALFGRRGEVRDGQDRYANLEVAHLLQRMETYRGLAILTTNLKSNVDKAFLRRLTVVLGFPFPGQHERAEIWRRVFPPGAPLEGVDPGRLSGMALTGGAIASIALAAAFAAAEDGTAITPDHLRRAARLEAAKHDRVLTDHDRAVLA
ncbi:AAA family ATPase [Salsipaludibacter albus]|uniref:AAA family ATPase n=1 Tax=Salsipaludibacter albus TaxID=2849650 RepID=UPI001EE4B9D3|nr:ATP-binding protein [Salsipaludibacter albus]MBY5164288.1 ATP-binding protein [Salsipaludibacter albus]